jgi:hypothetical protein
VLAAFADPLLNGDIGGWGSRAPLPNGQNGGGERCCGNDNEESVNGAPSVIKRRYRTPVSMRTVIQRRQTLVREVARVPLEEVSALGDVDEDADVLGVAAGAVGDADKDAAVMRGHERSPNEAGSSWGSKGGIRLASEVKKSS